MTDKLARLMVAIEEYCQARRRCDDARLSLYLWGAEDKAIQALEQASGADTQPDETQK